MLQYNRHGVPPEKMHHHHENYLNYIIAGLVLMLIVAWLIR